MNGSETRTCRICGATIECCEACEEQDCEKAVCHLCVSISLGQALAQPHGHGG